jgi:uncharacterized protein
MIKRFSLLTLVVVGLAASSGAQDISGDWQGPLTTPTGELRLVLHVTKQPDGTYKGTMDSPDQNSNGAPLDSITLEGSKVHFTLTVAKGFFDGTLKSNGSISGNWSQGTPPQKMPLVLTKTTNPIKTHHDPAPPSDIDGTWEGTIEAPQQAKLHVLLHFTNTADGLTATMDSPDQGMKGWPATSVTRKGSSVKVAMNQIGGVFEGKISKGLNSISGDWSQGPENLPLVLNRTKQEAAGPVKN